MKSFFKWIKYHPLRVALVGVGILLLMMAPQVQATAFVDVSSSSHAFQLKPGTSLPIDVSIVIQGDEAVTLSFTPQAHPFLQLDGQLHPITSPFSFTRHLTIKAAPNAPPGDHTITLFVEAFIGGARYAFPQTYAVKVMPSGFTEFRTTPDSTLAPFITQIVFSEQDIELNRNDTELFSVSFVNQGSATDYRIEFTEQPVHFKARIQGGVHRFVQPGERVQSVIEVSTDTRTPFDTYSLSLRARNLVTQDTTFLGTVLVRVDKVSHALVALPTLLYEVEEQGTVASYITIENTEWNELDVLITTSSPRIKVSSPSIRVPPKSSLSIPITIFGSDSPGLRSESLFIVSPDFDAQVHFTVQTIPTKIIPGETERVTQTILISNATDSPWGNVFIIPTSIPQGWDVRISPTRTSIPFQSGVNVTIDVIRPEGESGSFDLQVFNDGVEVDRVPIEFQGEERDPFSGLFVLTPGPIFLGILLLILLVLIFSSRVRDFVRAKLYRSPSSGIRVRDEKVDKTIQQHHIRPLEEGGPDMKEIEEKKEADDSTTLLPTEEEEKGPKIVRKKRKR
ncbi:MAG: hypothetical protein U1C71_04720 [archaeon]|nr:hypothetical protein [archaeon]